MSQENVEIVRRMYEIGWNGLDAQGIAKWFDPDIEWWDRGDEPEPTVHRGLEAVFAYWTELNGFLEGFDVEAQEFIDAGECVLVPVRLSGRGRESGAPFEGEEVHVFRLRDGRVTELREYATKQEPSKPSGCGSSAWPAHGRSPPERSGQ